MKLQVMKRVISLALAGALGGLDSAYAAEIFHTHLRGTPAWIRGDLADVEMPDAALGQTEEYFAALHRALQPAVESVLEEYMGATGEEEILVHAMSVDAAGLARVSFRQKMSELSVVGSGFKVWLDTKSGRITGINGRFYPWREEYDLESLKLLSFERALARARVELHEAVEPLELYELAFLGGGEELEIAYRVRVDLSSTDGPDDLWMRATDGGVLKVASVLKPVFPPPPSPAPQLPPTKQEFRSLNWFGNSSMPPYDWLSLCDLDVYFPMPGFLTVSAAPCSRDFSGARAQDHSIKMFRYFKIEHSWASYDDNYSPLESVVHYRTNPFQPLNNAFWNPVSKRMLYGDGDGNIFYDLTLGFDVGAHEMTHGVTEELAGLIYEKESGALDEAFSDIFAAAAETWVDGGTSADAWLIGEDIVGPGLGHPALRFMSNPTLDGYSADYYPDMIWPEPCDPGPSNDNCGVHGNSGIANLAFYLLVEGGTHPTGKTSVAVSGIGMDKAAAIYFRAIAALNPSDGFIAARLATEEAAAALYGSSEVTSVSDSWAAVGVVVP